jgi:hypothetical protein
VTKVPEVLGRRGMCLLFFGLLDVVYAISLASPDVQTASSPLFIWLTTIAPLWCWSLLWGVTAVACLFFAFRKKDRLGFSCAITLKVLWGLVNVSGWLGGGVERGYVSATIWLALAGFVWVLSGWPEPASSGRESSWTRRSS